MKERFESVSVDYNGVVLDLEQSMRDHWRNEKVNSLGDEQHNSNSYVLGMFPYPSGNAHMGHAFVFSITDTISRLKRFKGENVLHPLGWDAFGLPAENASIKNNIHPADWTAQNIKEMRDKQIGKLGFSFNEDKELNTSSPEYYKWTQWLFLQLKEAGLVYRAQEWVNWDPVDNTVLANEQVIDGKGWRSGASIEQRKMEQWYIRITDYAERLHQGLETLSGWSDAAKSAQRHWIGRSEGTDVQFEINHPKATNKLTIFTTRAEIIYGASAIIISPENEELDELINDELKEAISIYRGKALKKSEIERSTIIDKTGINIGLMALHPLTGQELPIYIAEYVIDSHGTGAIMCVPAHDKKDFDFSQKMNLPKIRVIQNDNDTKLPQTEVNGTLINSEYLNGLDHKAARKAVEERLGTLGIGSTSIRYRLKDWPLGRQRFWGAPIPMIQDQKGNWHGLRTDQLPVELPSNSEAIDFKQSASLSSNDAFKNFIGNDGEVYTRETETMDTFMCSSWYAWRFIDPNNTEQAWDPEEAKKWMPLNTYVGGLEHANQHLIYFRFMSYFLHDNGLTPTEEPIINFLNNGMVQMNGSKMSKSKGNVIRPDEIMQKYSSDALHMYILSNGPHDRDFEWDESGLRHKQNFLARIHKFFTSGFFFDDGKINTPDPKILDDWSRSLLADLDITAQNIEDEVLKNSNFHVAIGKTHELANTLFAKQKEANTPERIHSFKYVAQNYLKILGITAPHLTDYLWRNTFNQEHSLFKQPWIQVHPDLIPKEEQDLNIPILVNGKKRSEISISSTDLDETILENIVAKAGELNLQKHFENSTLGKSIVVRQPKPPFAPKLVNLQLITK